MRKPNIVSILAGSAVALLGLLVLTGWYTHNTALLQVLPSFVAMVYNTALAFLLSGAALLLIVFHKARLGAALGVIVTSIGLLTILEYAFGVDLGIDQLLMTAYTVSQTATAPFGPGRMAITTAICLTLTGAALIVMAIDPARLRRQAPTLAVLGSLVVALATVPLFGYLTGIASSYAWGAYTRMAVHTATGLIVIGTGIVAFAWQQDRARMGSAPRWLPLLVGIAATMATFILWQASFSEQRVNTRRLVASETAVIKDQISERMNSRIDILNRLAER